MGRPKLCQLYTNLIQGHLIMYDSVCVKNHKSVVATTRPMSNSSTNSKSQGQISSGNMSCVFTTTVFYWLFILSIHGLYYNCVLFYPNVHALSSWSLLIFHVYLKANMPCPCALTSYSLISVIHVCTMCTPWGTHVSWHHSISKLFLILLDPKSFQTILDSSRPYDITYLILFKSVYTFLSYNKEPIPISSFWILSQVLPDHWALAKSHCLLAKSHHLLFESHYLLPQCHHLLPQRYCSLVLDKHIIPIVKSGNIGNILLFKSPINLSPLLLVSNSPWCTPSNFYTLSNPHYNLSYSKLLFQTVNVK